MNNFLADVIMLLHFLWAAFMVIGLPLGLWLKSSLFRWIHFGGMMATAFFATAGRYCPLTFWEDWFRWKADPGYAQNGSFLARYLSQILYPGIDERSIRTMTLAWGLLTLLSFVIRWPGHPWQRSR